MRTLVNKDTQKVQKRLADTSKLGLKISFSFELFEQINYFGLGDCDENWYLLLLKALKSLSNMTTKELLDNNKQLHYHKIDWNNKNIPIQQEDLAWIDEENRTNLWQIHITKSKGRIIGFIYNQTFYIVLLDPKHNMQPCKRNKYNVRETTIKTCESENTYDELEIKYNELVAVIQKSEYSKLQELVATQSHEYRNIVYTIFDNDEDFQWYIDTTGGMSYHDIMTDYLVLKG